MTCLWAHMCELNLSGNNRSGGAFTRVQIKANGTYKPTGITGLTS